jgi:hypothetical protein
MGKEKEKIKRKGVSCLAGPGGVFRPTRARARAGARWWPSSEGWRGGTVLRRGAHMPARGREFNDVGGNGGRGRPTGGGNPRRFSVVGPVPRRGGGVAARAEAGDHRGGANLTGGAYGGRSAVRWQVSTAVRLPGAIGGGKGRLVTVSVWRSFEHWLIGLMITRKGERGSPERRGKHGGASLIRSGEGGGVGRSWCDENGARAVPFIGARERERDGGDGERRRARHDGGNGANGDWDGSSRRGVTGRLGHSGGVVAEAGASLNGEATGREALGGERVGEAWARTTELTGGPELPGRGSGARGRESSR